MQVWIRQETMSNMHHCRNLSEAACCRYRQYSMYIIPCRRPSSCPRITNHLIIIRPCGVIDTFRNEGFSGHSIRPGPYCMPPNRRLHWQNTEFLEPSGDHNGCLNLNDISVNRNLFEPSWVHDENIRAIFSLNGKDDFCNFRHFNLGYAPASRRQLT